MALNDIIDRRRDRQLAAHRPLPSGRIALATAHVICGALFFMAMVAGFIYARKTGATGWMSLVLVVWTVFREVVVWSRSHLDSSGRSSDCGSLERWVCLSYFQ
jgi:heme O synthase-like polyprenyltransferase